MKIVTFCIYITICFLIIGCKKSTSTIRDNAYDSVEKYETELEKLCLESHNGSVTYSIRIKTEGITNDYEYKYLGSLKIKKNNFKVIKQKILSGQYQDSQRAAVSIRLFLKGKLYGEFTELNNFYKIKITSNMIISAIWYRRSGRMVPPVSRCRIFHSGDVVPHQISFFDILVHQRV